MKKLLSFVLSAVMLLSCASAVFAVEGMGLVLAEGSHLVLDTEKGYVDKIDGTITVAELKANFAGNNIGVAGKADDAAVATDDVITAGGGSTIKALIYGDVNRDGKITLSDVSGILQSIAGWQTDVNTDAADVDKTGAVNLADITKILKSIAGWDDISLGNVRMIFENKKIDAEHEDSTLALSFVDMMYKNGRDVAAYPTDPSIKMKLAKNENESCQAILYSENAREGLSAELTPFVSEFGDATMESELEWIKYYDHNMAWPIITNDKTKETGFWLNNEEYVKWHSVDIPEVVLDMADTFELEAGLVQHFIITTKSTKDTPAGMYTATLNIKEGDKVIKTATVYAYVWDFALPDAPYSASIFANAQYVADKGNGESDGVDYYNMMLDNNMSSYVLPYNITDPRADEYMNDPRVTAFVIAGGGHMYGDNMYGGLMDESDEQTIANYNKVMSNPEWAKKGLFYYTDEPYGERVRYVRTTWEYVTNLLGVNDIRNITPLAGNGDIVDESGKTVDYVAYIDPYINVWCPQSPAYQRLSEGGLWTPRRFLKTYGEYADRAKAFKEKGEETWWYVCCSPEIPYANYYTWYQGVVVRLLSWQQYFNDVDGVLYYGISVHWNTISKYNFDITNGDGTLAFAGEMFGRTGPQESWRLYQIRDGFDDFDYLTMAEELVGREEVMKIVNKVTSGMLNYTEDYQVLEAARDEIVDIILEAQGK
ncbi:MAG: DUF4091 domain-containing protein [Clostridia bacterium]|nr:DUF4091 domain-containing protein [Clostridia bacterium]